MGNVAMIPIRWLLYIAGAIALYWPAHHGPSLYDDPHVFAHAAKQDRNWAVHWRPLSWIIWQWQAKAGVTVWGHHITNVVLHGINAVFVEQLVVSLGYSETRAILAAVLFTAHPLAVNAVASMSGRSSILGTMFGLIALLFTLHDMWWAVIAAIFIGACFKEDAIVYLTACVALAFLTTHIRTAEILLASGMIGLGLGLPWLLSRQHQSDTRIRRMGIAGAHRPLRHAWITLKYTVWLLPQWLIGAGSSPWHGDGLQ